VLQSRECASAACPAIIAAPVPACIGSAQDAVNRVALSCFVPLRERADLDG
jgi:hypothetical protein